MDGRPRGLMASLMCIPSSSCCRTAWRRFAAESCEDAPGDEVKVSDAPVGFGLGERNFGIGICSASAADHEREVEDATIPSADGSLTPEELYAKGLALKKNGNLADAVVALRAATAIDEYMSSAWVDLAVCQNELHHLDSAEASLCKALEHEPRHVRAHYTLGFLLAHARNDFQAAEAHYRRALEIDPTCAQAHHHLGHLVLHVYGDVREAEVCYRRAISYNDTYAPAHYDLALLLEDVRRDYDGAEASYRMAIKADPYMALAHNNLGALLMDVRKDYDRAEQAIRRAIEVDPKYGSAYYNLGYLLENKRKDLGGAETAYRLVIEVDPNNAMAYWNLAAVLEALEKMDGAVDAMHGYIRAGNPREDGHQRLKELQNIVW